jgi:hypothetical protein
MMLPSWLVIGAIALIVAFALNRLSPTDTRWFARLRRPDWLTIERAIPFIWTFIFICGVWSAVQGGEHGTWNGSDLETDGSLPTARTVHHVIHPSQVQAAFFESGNPHRRNRCFNISQSLINLVFWTFNESKSALSDKRDYFLKSVIEHTTKEV